MQKLNAGKTSIYLKNELNNQIIASQMKSYQPINLIEIKKQIFMINSQLHNSTK